MNRVFRTGRWLIVDYLGIATDLQEAVSIHRPWRVPAMQQNKRSGSCSEYEIARDFFHRFDYRPFDGAPERVPSSRAMEHPPARRRSGSWTPSHGFRRRLRCPSRTDALAIRDDVAFFQTVRASFARTRGGWRSREWTRD